MSLNATHKDVFPHVENVIKLQKTQDVGNKTAALRCCALEDGAAGSRVVFPCA